MLFVCLGMRKYLQREENGEFNSGSLHRIKNVRNNYKKTQ